MVAQNKSKKMDLDILKREDRHNFLDVLNKRGFILEDRVQSILDSCVTTGETIIRSRAVGRGQDRIEIDAIAYLADRVLVLECKRTEYSWIFPKEQITPNTIITLTPGGVRGMFANKRGTDDFVSVTSDVALEISEGKLVMSNRQDVKVSFKDIRDHVRQVLKETEAAFRFGHITGKVYPIVVTNADLFLFRYNISTDIDARGNLIRYTPLERVPYLIYNISEMMQYVNDRIIRIEKEPTNNLKSVFIVNIEHLAELISELRLQDT